MIITITHVEQAFTKNGDEYRKVVGITGDGRETTKSVFNQLKDKWGMLQENATLDFKMVKKGQFWNIEDINLPQVSAPAEKPTLTAETPDQPEIDASVEKPLARTPAPQEIGMWFKEAGEMIRAKDIKQDHPMYHDLRNAYYKKMFEVLGIPMRHKEDAQEMP